MAESQQRLIRGLELPYRNSGTSEDPGMLDEHRMRTWLKVLYEFWGYCINAPSSLDTPGAMLAKTFPAGFENGDVVESGTDGVTQFSTPGYFFANSVTWSSEHVGKYVVMWKPGEESPDDSIYRILTVINTDTVLVDAMGGGGTVHLGNRPTFSDRSRIYFRVVGIETVGTLAGWTNDMGMVLTFSGSSAVNTGQLPSQIRVFVDTVSGNQEVKLQASPSGSWNGSAFTDGSNIISPLREWTDFEDSTVFLYFAGSKDHIISVMGSEDADSTYSGIHIEIPKRMYPQEIDPNPIVFMTYGTTLTSWDDDGFTGGQAYGTSLYSPGVDGTNQRAWPAHRMFVSNIFEELSLNEPFWSNPGQAAEFAFQERSSGGIGYTGRYHEFEKNDVDRRVLSTDVVCYDRLAARFTLGRFRLRKVRASHGNQPSGVRHGRNWIHFRAGILLPWDNAIIHYGPFWRRW